LLLPVVARAGVLSESYDAPEWVVSEWVNSSSLEIEALRGKVVVIEFFDLGCTECDEFSAPLMKGWAKRYRSESDILFVSFHSATKGSGYQSPEKLKNYINHMNITRPVGIDKYLPGLRTPITLRRYKSQGTPGITIVDKKGRVRYQQSGPFDTAAPEDLIAQLLSEKV